MNALLTYIIAAFKTLSSGDLPTYTDPAAPSDLGTALTQAEIDFVKKLKKEMEERFLAP